MSIRKDILANWPNYRDSGMKIPQIAELYNCAQVTVRNVIKELDPQDQAYFIRPYRKKAEEAKKEKKKEEKKQENLSIEIEERATSRINKELKKLRKEYKTAKDALNAERQFSASLSKSNSSLQEEVKRLEKVAASKHATILGFAQKVQDLESMEIAYQEEISDLEKKLRTLEEDYEYLQTTDTHLLCSEDEHYEGELKDALVNAVESFLQQLPEGSNYRRLLECFLLENPPTESKAVIEKAVEKIKTAANSEEVKSCLKKAGFYVLPPNRRGHIKARWRNDPRYQVTVPKTPSDKRHSWLNVVSDIRKLIF